MTCSLAATSDEREPVGYRTSDRLNPRRLGHVPVPYQIGRSTLVTTGPNGDRTAVVEFLVVWRREPGGNLRMVVDYYRY